MSKSWIIVVLGLLVLVIGCTGQSGSDGLEETVVARVALTTTAAEGRDAVPTVESTPLEATEVPTLSSNEKSTAVPQPTATPATPVPSATPTAIPSPTVPPTPSSKWVADYTVDPLTDVEFYTASIEAGVGSNFVGTPFELWISGCDETSGVAVLIDWSEYIDSGSFVPVTYRFGGMPAVESEWWGSDTSTWLFEDSVSREFIEHLLGADQGKFVASVAPYGEAPVVGIRDVTGIWDIYPEIKKTCNW